MKHKILIVQLSALPSVSAAATYSETNTNICSEPISPPVVCLDETLAVDVKGLSKQKYISREIGLLNKAVRPNELEKMAVIFDECEKEFNGLGG